MRKNEFRAWLLVTSTKKSANDRVSRCSSVERFLQIDLDKEFTRDHGCAVLEKLQYSIADERAGKDAPIEFPFKDNANIRFRMTDLRSSVKRYFDFCRETQNNI